MEVVGLGSQLLVARHSHRTVTTLQGVYRLRVKVYQCLAPACPRFHQVCRPEEEGAWALPHGEFGLDVIALIGTLRYQQQRSIPQILRIALSQFLSRSIRTTSGAVPVMRSALAVVEPTKPVPMIATQATLLWSSCELILPL